MISWQEFERLAAVARREPAPVVDVRAAVLVALRRRAARRNWLAFAPGRLAAGVDPLAIAWLAVSLALAIAAIGLASPAADTFGQSFVSCVNPLALWMQ